MAASEAMVRILIVDPKPQSRSTLKGALANLEIVHTVIERGATADLQDLLEKEPIHLVMLERYLTDATDALDAIRALREHITVYGTRFIIIDQQDDEGFRQRASELGATGFLVRPFTVQSLRKALSDGLGIADSAAPNAEESGSAKEAMPRVPKDVLTRLKRVQVFATFSDDELLRLLKICQFRRIPAGEFIFREGDVGDRLYVLISGQVEIKRRTGTASRVLDTLVPGNCFGEMAIIDSSPRSADAVAALDTTVVEIRAETVNRDDDVMALKLVRQLARVLTQRIRTLMVGR